MIYEDRRSFANFFFGWELDKKRTRLIFYTVLDTNGRNIQPFGRSLRRYPRWVEEGYENGLMRLTDFINSLPPHKRQRLCAFTSLGLLRPSEPLVYDLWEVARDRMPMAHLLQKWTKKTTCTQKANYLLKYSEKKWKKR